MSRPYLIPTDPWNQARLDYVGRTVLATPYCPEGHAYLVGTEYVVIHRPAPSRRARFRRWFARQGFPRSRHR